tara:strand:+ start:152 stop:532 length:381 start_codon:yes stop_codon:yes gene_type:complete
MSSNVLLKNDTTKRRLTKVVKKGKKNPLTIQDAKKLHQIDLDIDKFQRIARTYYKTQKLGLLLYLHSPLLEPNTMNPIKSVCLDFSDYENSKYIGASVRMGHVANFEFHVLNTKDLFIKLLRHKLI